MRMKISFAFMVGFVAAAVLVVALQYYGMDIRWQNDDDRSPVVPEQVACPADAKLCPDGSAVVRSGPNCQFAPCPSAPVETDTVRVTAPLPESVVGSPLTVTGQARGTWYFEASFPVTVRDANDQLLGTGVAQAQGDWMTTEFVPFQATVNFSASSTPTGFVVLHKDNPSGLPENDAQVRIPIRF